MSIFEFADYRPYLRSYVRSLPRSGYGELSRIAVRLKISSAWLSQILSGARDLNLDQGLELADHLSLTELETEYLTLLIESERAGAAKTKAYLRKKLQRTKDEALKVSRRISFEKQLGDVDRALFYSSWLYAAVHLFTGTVENGTSLEEICTRFAIDRKRASEIIQFLVRTRLCIEKSGRYAPGVQSTFVEQGSPHLLKHHSNWRIRAIQKSESLSEEELMFTAPVSLAKRDFALVREQLVQLIKKLSDQVKESEPQTLAQLNIDWLHI